MSERNEIYELALKFIESEEMREYWGDTLLSENISTRLSFNPVRDCREFITGSRSSVDDKLAALRKLIPDGTGELLHKITWTLNAKGEILFFELADGFEKSLHEDDDWKAWFDWEGSDNWTYPPVPFYFGDVITIDMRPFYEAFHGVIVRLEDNCDCCAVACISCDADGYLYCSALKHGMDKVLTKISPLYRAQKFMGELPKNEQVLKIISKAIKKIPSVRMNRDGESVWRQHELAEQFDEFFCEILRSGNYKKQNGFFGCSWDEFWKKFKI